MLLQLEIPEKLQSELVDEAIQVGLPLPDYALLLLMKRRITDLSDIPPIHSGSELVDYWERDGLIGTRYDIGNSQAHARILRERAQQRDEL